ncbi:hypothetical protein X943_003315 [Babesia divergens]|uniref:Uncharacterized protein n=1 Tax=Babesia divergens TaxID=32595 RepID=A0AAD9LIE0_BABDI|nr:hypothetical protein X943_003315 [Babesia divergens]
MYIRYKDACLVTSCQSKGFLTVASIVHMDKAVACNKPDIVVADYSKNVITFVEVGITCQDNLGQVERDKEAKYKALTEQMGNHRMNALTTIEVVPYVMTWDGLVTKRHTECRLKLGVSDRVEGQLQRICLQQTYDFVMRGLGIEVMEELEGWVQGMSRRSILSLPDPGPMPMAVAPAVLWEVCSHASRSLAN